jgi:non-specific serine/threonine protein kinase
VAEDQGDLVDATALFEESIAVAAVIAEPSWTAWSHRNIGRQALLRGDIAEAERRQQAALALFRQEGNGFGVAYVLGELADVALTRGDLARAAALWRERLKLSWNEGGLYWELEGLAAVAVGRGDDARAARLLGAAEAHRSRLGIAQTPSRAPWYERTVAATRAALDETTFAAAWDDGRQWSADRARAEALQAAQAPTPLAAPKMRRGATDHGLTHRELEIVRLVAAGCSNREVAASLFISVPTVKRHLTTILAKLDLSSRSALTAYAHTHGLV